MFYYDALVVRVDELHEHLLCGANLIYLALQFTELCIVVVHDASRASLKDISCDFAL